MASETNRYLDPKRYIFREMITCPQCGSDRVVADRGSKKLATGDRRQYSRCKTCDWEFVIILYR